MFGSLTYQFIGFVPCPFCWYQRILMYPVAIMSLIALIKRQASDFWSYAMVLSVIGVIIALWHNTEKLLGKDVLACDAIGVSCLQNYVKVFGFIDIPVMSLVFFISIILLIVNKRRFS
jgi:disulfide bond formation protein DsbB